MSAPDEIEAAIGRIEVSLKDFTGGFSIPEPYLAIGREIRFIETRLTFAGFEIAKLRNSVNALFGPSGRRGDVASEKRDARSECHSLRGKAAQLRLFAAAKDPNGGS
jgi:hypothetical protein